MTPARAVHIISGIANALDYAHQNGVVHRDVKPANFLLSTDAHGAERVLLADFGIAHSLGDGQPPATGSVLATVAYAAPEVFNGAPVDGRADLYSLGCSLFRLLTGRKPFPSQGDTSAVIKGHLYDTPPKVTDFAADLPVALNDVIATALAKDPADRFQSGRELAAAATRALRQHRPPPPPSRSRISSIRDDWAGQGAPLITPTFDAAAFAALSARARRHQERRRRIALACALLVLVVTLAGVVFWVSRPAAVDDSSDDPPTTSGTQTQAQPRSPDAETRLRGLLPPGYVPDSCHPVAPTSGALAAIECSANRDPGGPTTANYLLMADTASLRSTFNAVVKSMSVLNCPGNIQSPGLCPTGVSTTVGEVRR